MEGSEQFGGFDIFKNPTVESLTIKQKEEKKTVKKEDKEEKTPEELEREAIAEEARLAAEQEEFLKNQKKDKKEDDKEEEETPAATIKKDKKDDTEETFSFKEVLIKPWLDKGIVDVNIDELEDSEESIEKAIELTVDKRFKERVESYPDEMKKFHDFVEAGGDPKKFLELYYGSDSYEDLDITNERDQKVAIAEFLKLTGADEEEIDETISDYEASGLLEKHSEKAKKKLLTYEKEQKRLLIDAQKQAAEEHKVSVKKYWEDLEDRWMKKDDLNGFPLTDKIKNDVFKHMTKPVDKKTGKSQLAINNEKNEDAQFLYAYLDMLNWDISKLEKQVKTKVTSEIRQKLQNYTDSRDKLKTGKTRVDEENASFDGFKSLK